MRQLDNKTMGYAKRRKNNRLIALLSNCLIVIAIAGCTRVNDGLGSDFVPKNQLMTTLTGRTNGMIETRLWREPRVRSSRAGYVFLGNKVDAGGVFGAQKNSAILQYLPISIPSEDYDGYGANPAVDSVFITLTHIKAMGDVSKTQTFEGYELIVPVGTDSLSRDSLYYSDFPAELYKGDKLFTFNLSGHNDVSREIATTIEGDLYFNRIVHWQNREGTALEWRKYLDDDFFHSEFYGFYITPADTSDPDAAVYSFDLAGSGFLIYSHNTDPNNVTLQNPAGVADTLSTLFSFRDTDAWSNGSVTKWNNVSIGIAQVDYSGSKLGDIEAQTGGFTDTLSAGALREETYIHPMGGVVTHLTFTQEFKTALDNLPEYNPSEQDIKIDRAVMRIEALQLPSENTADAMSRSLPRLGSYFNFKELKNIPDYNYATEIIIRQQGNDSYRLPYNGYLNRGTGIYELDITSYVQDLAGGRDIAPTFTLGPAATDLFNSDETILVGSEDTVKKISVSLNYTLIDKNK